MALLLLAQSTNFCKEAWMNIRMFSMWPDGSFKTWGTWGSAKKIWGTFHVDAPYQVQMMWVSQGSLVAAFGPSRNQSLGAPGSQGLSRWLQRCCTDWLVMIRKNSCQLDVYSCVYIYISFLYIYMHVYTCCIILYHIISSYDKVMPVPYMSNKFYHLRSGKGARLSGENQWKLRFRISWFSTLDGLSLTGS